MNPLPPYATPISPVYFFHSRAGAPQMHSEYTRAVQRATEKEQRLQAEIKYAPPPPPAFLISADLGPSMLLDSALAATPPPQLQPAPPMSAQTITPTPAYAHTHGHGHGHSHGHSHSHPHPHSHSHSHSHNNHPPPDREVKILSLSRDRPTNFFLCSTMVARPSTRPTTTTPPRLPPRPITPVRPALPLPHLFSPHTRLRRLPTRRLVTPLRPRPYQHRRRHRHQVRTHQS